MKALSSLTILFLLAVFLFAGCGPTTSEAPSPDSDFAICENILRAWIQAINAQNFALALSYCKIGGDFYENTQHLWQQSIEKPYNIYVYTLTNIYDRELVTTVMIPIISMKYDYTRDLYYHGSFVVRDYFTNKMAVFTKVDGDWKLR